tara:strand:- start:6 stop:428 length:423 start_codon:yes stop_codon:yes gene_type:complete
MITEAGKGIRGTPGRRLTIVDAAGTDRGMPGGATETYPGIGTNIIGMAVVGKNIVVAGVRATSIGNDRATTDAETAIDTTGTTPTGRRTIRRSHRITTTTGRSTRRRKRTKKTKRRRRTRRTARSTSARAATAMTTGSAR